MPLYSLAEPVAAELEIKRSRFLAVVAPVTDEPAARAVVAAARANHPKARHHCSAFVLGPAPQVRRSSDDGEPSGTAGIPMLDVLVGRELTDVVAVVTRYFGGTLLGAGGLVRAYGGAVSAALEDAAITTRDLLVPLTVTVPYALAELLRARIGQAGWRVLDQRFAAEVTLTFAVPRDAVPDARAVVADLSAGRIEPVEGRADWL